MNYSKDYLPLLKPSLSVEYDLLLNADIPTTSSTMSAIMTPSSLTSAMTAVMPAIKSPMLPPMKLVKEKLQPITFKSRIVITKGIDRKCSFCYKKFKFTAFWQIFDQSKPFNTKPYKCIACDARYPDVNQSRKYQRLWTPCPVYKCPVCTKEFTQLSKMERHKRIHTGEKPYKCVHCDKEFTQKSNLNAHGRVHTGMKTYKCLLCIKSFTRLGNLHRHEVKMHGGVKVEEK